MKTLQGLLLTVLLLSGSFLSAQQQYVIDGNTYTPNTEVTGTITLLWNTIDGQYRFFSQQGDIISELVNTKANGDYQEEYKAVLKNQTGSDTSDLKLTIGSLRNFFDSYNASQDSSYTETPSVQINIRLGLFAGLTNSVYTANPNNALQPKVGLELELIDEVMLKRHAIVFRLGQTFANDEQKNSNTQISFNYRFKCIKKEKIDVFVNAKIAAYNFSNDEIFIPATDTAPARIEETSSNGLEAPIAIGLGADYKVGPGHITLSYNDIFALTEDSNGEFPLDVTVGYKIGL